jgi:oleate hydratase
MYGPTFLDCLARLTRVDSARAGLITLTESPWQTTLAPCPKPHFASEPDDATVMWGYSICPEERVGGKEMWNCTGKEILTETVHELGFDDHLSQILAESECVPCRLPHANSVWMTRNHADRPEVHPANANFAFIGQFCEMPQDTMFTMEYSVRSAREAASALCNSPVRRPPPVYQGWRDPAAIAGAVRTFLL